MAMSDEHFRDMEEYACMNGPVKEVKTSTPDDMGVSATHGGENRSRRTSEKSKAFGES